MHIKGSVKIRQMAYAGVPLSLLESERVRDSPASCLQVFFCPGVFIDSHHLCRRKIKNNLRQHNKASQEFPFSRSEQQDEIYVSMQILSVVYGGRLYNILRQELQAGMQALSYRILNLNLSVCSGIWQRIYPFIDIPLLLSSKGECLHTERGGGFIRIDCLFICPGGRW